MKKTTLLASAISACFLASSLNIAVLAKDTRPTERPVPVADNVHTTQAPEKKVKPGALAKVISTNRQVYYIGSSLQVRVVVPSAFKAAWNGEADTYLVLYGPGDVTLAMPITLGGENALFKPGRAAQIVAIDALDTATLTPGVYQLALVATEKGGDPLNLGNWYEGFRGLLGVTRVKFSDQPVGQDAEDTNGDGEVDGDADSDGFEDDTHEYDTDDAGSMSTGDSASGTTGTENTGSSDGQSSGSDSTGTGSTDSSTGAADSTAGSATNPSDSGSSTGSSDAASTSDAGSTASGNADSTASDAASNGSASTGSGDASSSSDAAADASAG